MKSWLLVFLGGGAGSLVRFALARYLAQPGPHFPWATFWTNLLSCLILGILAGLRSRGMLQPGAQYLLMTGFCGGFSTFSTFSLEALTLFDQQQHFPALLYLMLSVVLGLGMVYVGIWVVSMV